MCFSDLILLPTLCIIVLTVCVSYHQFHLDIFFLVTLLHASHTNALDFKAYGFIQPETSIYINGDGKHGQDNYNTSLFGKGTFVSYLQNGDAKFTISAIGRFDQNDDQLRYLDFQKFKYERVVFFFLPTRSMYVVSRSALFMHYDWVCFSFSGMRQVVAADWPNRCCTRWLS